MKRILILGVVFMLMLPLAACGETVASETTSEGNLPLTSLLIGTLRLEGTDLAVDPEMATALLPLWQAARTVYTSDSSAVQEQEAIQEQIMEAMTPEQLAAIQAMDLSTENLGQAMQELLGDTFPEGFPFGEGFEGFMFSGEGSPEGFPEGFPEGMPEGFEFGGPGGRRGSSEGMPDFQGGGILGGPGSGDGLGQGPGQALSPEAQATLQAERGSRGSRFANPMMFELIIEFLRERAQEG